MLKALQHIEGNIFSDIWAVEIKLSVIVDTYTYLCYTDKKSPIFNIAICLPFLPLFEACIRQRALQSLQSVTITVERYNCALQREPAGRKEECFFNEC